MQGLLDFLKTPAGQGLLATGLGVAASAGRGRGLVGNLGQGGLMGLQAYAGAQQQEAQQAENAQQRQVREMQLRKMQADLSDEEMARETAKKYYNPGTPAMGQLDSSLPPQFQTGAVPVAGQAPKFDLQGFAQARMAQNPLAGMKLLSELQKETPINKLDVKDFTPASVQKFAQTKNYADLVRLDKLHFADTGGAIAGLDPFTGKPVGTTPKTGNPFNDLVLSDGQGGLRPNAPLVGVKRDLASAGASRTNVSVNTEKSLLNEIAGGFGKSVVDAKAGAQGALSTINTVGRLMDAIDSGKVMAGPGTTFRQYGLQVGNLLGVTGKDAQEKLLNTRQAIQSLAQLELDAAQQMKGQGQITEAERSIIRRAASGDIDGMTTGELKLLGGVLDRTARTKIRGYNAQVKPLASNPNAAPLAPFLNVEEPAERTAPNVLRFDANGNPVR
jgi:hypothetical protein